MSNFIRTICLCLTTLSVASIAVADELDEKVIKELALEAILENPEVIMQAVEILKQREAAEKEISADQAILSNWGSLQDDPNAPVLGNPDGDITIVEFFDYNCGYCKRAAPIISKLLEADNNVRLVYREWPILTDGSRFAARASLAAQKQGRYKEFHFKLMSLSRATEESVLKAAQEFGYDLALLQADMADPNIDQHIETSNRLSNALGFTGTPSFVVGTKAIPGLVSYEDLTQVIAAERKKTPK